MGKTVLSKVRERILSPKRALVWVSIWVSTASIFAWLVFKFSGSETFCWGIFSNLGPEAGVEFITCYAIEWTLSMDNLFVFLMIFNSFGVIPVNQLRALTWGIIGAIIMRLAFILIGVTLVKAFEPVLYFFGVLLIYSAIKMAISDDKGKDMRKSPIIRAIRKRFAILKNFHGEKFIIRRNGKIFGTPLILVLVAIESSDVMFAIDSVPAAFAVTNDPFIIFTANMFAILGLRSLYFLLVKANQLFDKLRYGIVIILGYVGVKIILQQLNYHINTYLSLSLILGCLIVSVIVSLATAKKAQ